MNWIRITALACATALGLAVPVAAQSQQSGTVAGRVTDDRRGDPLPGALVRIEGTALSTAADQTGAFRLAGVPVGQRTLVVSFLGRAEQRTEVTVVAGQALDVAVSLPDDLTYSETVTVQGESIQEGQARALNQQRTALNITNVVASDQIGSFPDPNAAEAASRIPGVSIARDQGEGRYVLVRGTEARLNSMMIDGERIPAPEGDLRQVALDAVPADQLQSIEVSKALTPDMDADSIGGAINLITRQAVAQPMLIARLAGGYNALQQNAAGQRQASATAGRRFAGGRVGVLAGFSGSSLDRGSENFEPSYDDGELEEIQLRDYQINRERYGFNLTTDFRAGNSLFTVKGMFNEFKDYEINNRIIFVPEDDEIQHYLKNRNQNQHIRSVSFRGQHAMASGSVFDYGVAWGAAKEDQPDGLDTVFIQSDVPFSPNVSPDFIDPDNIQANPAFNSPSAAELDEWEQEIFDTTDRDVTLSFNVRTPLRITDSAATFLKAGARFKDKNKAQNLYVATAGPEDDVLLPSLMDNGFENDRFLDFLDGRYAPFPGINPGGSRSLFNRLPSSAIEFDNEADAETYDATERVVAGYVMAELFLGPRLTIVPGVRFESTKVDYTGFEVLYDEDGDYTSTEPIAGGDTYGLLMPGVNVRYAVSEDTNIRAAVTRSLARPNYYDLVPYRLVVQEDREIERGNPSLKPTTSTNLDLMAERYFRSVGVVSAGVFYKQMNDYIYQYHFDEDAFGDEYEVTEPRNGDSASLWGMELAFQNQLRFLPHPFDGLGLYANYTLTDSSATFPDRDEDATLPGQSRHVGNVAVWYEKFGFSAKASWNFHGKYIDEVGDEAVEDEYYDDHTQLDISLSQRVSRNITAYADFLNLTNSPLRYYLGTASRPIQEEYYRWWGTFGVRLNW